jgi:hypothetical protein
MMSIHPVQLRDVDIVSAMNVVSGLKHPNISAIIGALLHQGDFYIVSEFCGHPRQPPPPS